MNEIVKSGFLDTIFCKRDSIIVDYDFRNPSFTGVIDSTAKTGYVFFTNFFIVFTYIYTSYMSASFPKNC